MIAQTEEIERRFYRTRESDEKLEKESIRLAIKAMRDEGYAEGYAQGFAEGKLEKEHEMILNLYGIGVPKKDIAKATSLTISEINYIIRKKK